MARPWRIQYNGEPTDLPPTVPARAPPQADLAVHPAPEDAIDPLPDWNAQFAD